MSLNELNPLLSERSRLVIMAALAAAPKGLSFNDLLAASGLTRGNLSTHVRRLEESGLVEVSKEFRERKPHTSYRCSSHGRAQLQAYLKQVEELLKGFKS